jgi:hypothetical protein
MRIPATTRTVKLREDEDGMAGSSSHMRRPSGMNPADLANILTEIVPFAPPQIRKHCMSLNDSDIFFIATLHQQPTQKTKF